MDGQTSVSNQTKIVKDFCQLMENSNNLFNGLREIPQQGRKVWQPYFSKTFDAFTKLWKFQQENREILNDYYGLKRWQIGEIASKIAQLYYHYYLRTSETNYLNEAHEFYSAIRVRNYFKGVSKEENRSELLQKKHRYFARFIVVCLLLDHKQQVRELVQDFARHVDMSMTVLGEKDYKDWRIVIGEIKDFLCSDQVRIINPLNGMNYDFFSARMTSQTLPPPDNKIKTYLTLGDAIIIGNSPCQLKFSELTVDMYRMMQIIEREPTHSPTHPEGGANINQTRENPHKYLLYKPSVTQVLSYLSTAMQELLPTTALLLYISADGIPKKQAKNVIAEVPGYENGGVLASDGKDLPPGDRKVHTDRDPHCFYPGDLHVFLRQPMMLIMDSENAWAFDELPDLFNQPVICLMAPAEIPNPIKEMKDKGRLMTSFLFSPVTSLMTMCGVEEASDVVYEQCGQKMEKAVAEVQRIFVTSNTIDSTFDLFLGDDFFRLILIRFALFKTIVHMHRAYKNARFYPTSYPALNADDFGRKSSLNKYILAAADVIGMRGLFQVTKN